MRKWYKRRKHRFKRDPPLLPPSELPSVVVPASASGQAKEEDLDDQEADTPIDAGLPQGDNISSNQGAGSQFFHGISIGGSSRAHLGNTYNNNVAFNLYQAEPLLPQGTIGTLMQTLEFKEMPFRLAEIAPAYAHTCLWVVETPEFIRWRDQRCRRQHHGILWVKGSPGVGKSTLMKCIVEHAMGQAREHEVVVSFFFNGRGFEIEKSTEGMYRSILHQVLQAVPRLQETLSANVTLTHPHTWHIGVLETLLRTAVCSLTPEEHITCYVDALDECHVDEVRRAISHFEELGELAVQNSIPFNICFASRYYPHITIARHETLRLDKEKKHKHDISVYVRRKLTVPGALKKECTTKILKRSSGVFLWVVLVVKIIKERSDTGCTRSELLAVVEAVPEGLHDLFASILDNVDRVVLSALQWVLSAKRPLSLPELYFAIKTSTHNLSTGTWDDNEVDLGHMRRFILHATRGLVELNAGSKNNDESLVSAQFIHESVKDHLLAGGLARIDDVFRFDPDTMGHIHLAEWCLDYIQLDVPLYLSGFENLRSMLRKAPMPLFSYALENTFYHLDRSLHAGSLPSYLWKKIPWNFWELTHKSEFFHVPRDPDSKSWTALYQILESDCRALATALLEQGSGTCGTCQRTQLSLLEAEIGCDHHLLALNINRTCSGNFGSVLALAAAHGLDRITQMLLDRGANIGIPGGQFDSPLGFAAAHGQNSTVQLLLDNGAEVDTRGEFWGSSLGAALQGGEVDTVRQLLDAGADVNFRGGFYGGALGISAAKGTHAAEADMYVLRLLLDHGLKVDPREGDYGCPLGAAVTNENLRMIDLLLTHGACVNSWSSYGPLHAAAQHHHEDLVRKFLQAGAEVDAFDESGRTPLYLVAEDNHFRYIGKHEANRSRVIIARMLLDFGANVNAVRFQQGSVLTTACEGRHTGLVKLLISRGADLHLRDAKGRTAMKIARERGAGNIVELLKQAIQTAIGWRPCGDFSIPLAELEA
jgi:ankyrin repeat protein